MTRAVLAAIFLLLAAGLVFAHSEEGAQSGGNEVFWLGVSTAIILAVVGFSVLSAEKMGAQAKKICYSIIVATIAISTLYVVGTTVKENLDSATGGPVHWHADYEVWACGERLALGESEGIEGREGESLLHNHNDYRIHVEGTVKELEDVSLGEYFHSIKGEFSSEQLKVVLKDGSVLEKSNGDLCSGRPGKVMLYVNGKPNYEFDDYVIAPYSQVPPGDYIRIVFDSKGGVPNGG